MTRGVALVGLDGVVHWRWDMLPREYDSAFVPQCQIRGPEFPSDCQYMRVDSSLRAEDITCLRCLARAKTFVP